MKLLLTITTLIFAALTAFFGWILTARMDLPYNAEGNYFNPKDAVTYHEQSVAAYGALTFVLLTLTLLSGYFALKKLRA